MLMRRNPTGKQNKVWGLKAECRESEREHRGYKRAKDVIYNISGTITII